MTTITREQLIKKAQEQIAFCRDTKVTGEGRAHVDQCAALFEIALAAMDSEPVAEVLSNRPGNDTSTIDRALPVGTQLYRHAQPAVDSDFIPKNLDKALGVLGMAIPESREEFNFQTERWIQRLIDRVIRYADEFQEQPAPVVTFYRDGIEAAAKWIDQQREAYDSEHGWSDPDTGAFEFASDVQRGYSSTMEELAEGIRALHPNAGNSPAIGIDPASGPDRTVEVRYVAPPGYVMVPKEPTPEILATITEAIRAMRGSAATYARVLAAAPQEVK